MLNIFLDTNIYLSFYRLSNEDIEKLESLIILINETEEIKLFITSQLIDEFYRNRDMQINDTLKNLKQLGTGGLNLPTFSKKYSEYQELKDAYKNFQSKRKKFEEKITSDIEKYELPPDEIIEKLFRISERLEKSDDILLKSKNRTELGNPPGKKGSLGDAIHWELLLEYIPNNEDLYFVGIDGDFKSILEKNKINSFLEREWKNNKDSEIFYFENLSTFLSKMFPTIGELDEYRKEKQIEQLGKSGSFNRARQVLGSLLKIGNFTDSQINKIIEYSLSNSQIYGANRYSPELIGGVLDQLTKDKHKIIKPELYDIFCEKFGIKSEIFYVKDKDGSYTEIPF